MINPVRSLVLPVVRPNRAAALTDVEDESTDGSGLSDPGDDAQGNESRGRAGLTDAAVDEELGFLDFTF